MASTRVMTAAAPKTGRVTRTPQHPFQIRARPWQIQPFLIAPVLPGETLASASLQSRVITDPIKNRLVGWWKEYYFFYVKHRDLDERAEFEQMVLDPEWSSDSIDSTADQVLHYFEHGTSGHINWVEKCLNRVTDVYFRDEGMSHTDYVVSSLPVARVTGQNWMDSMVPSDAVTFPDVDVDANADDTITVGEITAAMVQYNFLRENFALDMSYEDYLRTYGVVTPREDVHEPELLRYIRQWSYPVSAIDATDGSAASAVQWNIQERIEKQRFFKEPGFIFGVTITRPKVYFSGQRGTLTGWLEDAYSWLPQVLLNDQRTSLKLMPQLDGPVSSVTDDSGYWVDMRDLFLYGEQFVNFAMSGGDGSTAALPQGDLNWRFPSSSDMNGLFADYASANLVREDGIVSFNIKTHQMDQTAGSK